MARQRDLKRERVWRQHIGRQHRSGRTIRDYCFDHDLAEAAFHRWRRVIAERDAEAAPPALAMPAFVPVTVLDSSASPARSPIDIRLADGRRVRVRSGCDRALLAAVLALLEGRPC
jgi:hypothetical protein